MRKGYPFMRLGVQRPVNPGQDSVKADGYKWGTIAILDERVVTTPNHQLNIHRNHAAEHWYMDADYELLHRLALQGG